MSVFLPQFGITDLVLQDIDEVLTTDQNISDLVSRSNEAASSELESIFIGLVDFTVNPTDLPSWFISLATDYTTAYFWQKSNGTERSKLQLEKIREKAIETREGRFRPAITRG